MIIGSLWVVALLCRKGKNMKKLNIFILGIIFTFGIILAGAAYTGIVNGLLIEDGAWIGKQSGVYILFDHTNDDTSLMGGNVGIGTTEPGAKLEVVSTGTTEGLVVDGTGLDNNVNIMTLKRGTGTNRFVLEKSDQSVQTFLEAGSSIGLFGTVTETPFHIRTNYVERMVFAGDGSQAYINSGNVGIGTTGPDTHLDIDEDTLNTASILSLSVSSNAANQPLGRINFANNNYASNEVIAAISGITW